MRLAYGGDDPQGVGTDFRGVGLVEVLWKDISGIINYRLSYYIQFHDIMHGFHAGRGTGTATLKANLLQKIISMWYIVFHNIFVNLSKSYDALDMELCLDIMEVYGVGPRTIRILWTYWSRL